MGEPELTAEARHRFEVAAVAEAWLTRPRGYPRELRAVLGVLEPDEHVTKVFHVYLGNWLGRSGLLFFTRPRLIYVPRRLFRRRIVSITFESIRHVSVVETPRDLDIKVETSDDRVFGFWRGGESHENFLRLLRELKAEVGDRFVGVT